VLVFTKPLGNILTLSHNATSGTLLHLTTQALTASPHIIIRTVSTVQFGIFRERERPHLHNIFITCCYNCSILSLIIVVTLLLRLIYKLSFLIGRYRKKLSIELGTRLSFRHPLGGLGGYPLQIRGILCVCVCAIHMYMYTYTFA
jgi:hypothetical protein